MGTYNDPSYTAVTELTLDDADIVSIWQTSTGEVVQMTILDLKQYFNNTYGCTVRRTSNQSIASSAFAAISWDSEDFDEGGFHDNTTNPTRVTVPTDGLYIITGVANFSTWGTLARARLAVKKNGTTDYELFDGDLSNGSDLTINGTLVIYLTAGDYLELYVFNGTASSRNITTASELSVARIGL